MKKRNNLGVVSIGLILSILSLSTPVVNAVDTEITTATATTTTVVDETKGYFSDPNGTVWEFCALFNVPEGEDASNYTIESAYANGIILKETDETSPYHIQDYSTMNSMRGLVSPNDLTLGDIETIIQEILKSVIVNEEELVASYDYFQDGKISLPDYIYAQRFWNCTPMNFITNGDASDYQEMSFEDFFEILKQKSEAGEKEITIMYGDKPEVKEETTETSETTSTTTTTEQETTIATTTTTTKPETTTETTTATTKPETTTETTTVTTKPETTTETTTVTTKPETTTTTTSATTKPETTTTTTTATTKPETTTTTTSATTKPETTTATTTATTKPETTTATTTTTTKPETTTTSTTTTESETATETTTETTTTTPTEWTKPAIEDLVHDGEQIDQNTYDILINTAEMFGIDQYKIVWSDKPILYAYTDPGLYYCMKMGVAYGYGVQIAAGTDIASLCTEISNLEAANYKFSEFLCYRPLVDGDNDERVLSGFDVTEGAYKEADIVVMVMEDLIEPENIYTTYLLELLAANEYNPFEFANWYLVPLDDSGEEILELANNEYTMVETSVETNYWFTNEELTPDGHILPREDFYYMLKTAEAFNFDNFKVVYSEDIVYYGFATGSISSTSCVKLGLAQIVPSSDLLTLQPNLYEYYISLGYSEYGAEQMLQNDMNAELNPYYAWILRSLIDGTYEVVELLYNEEIIVMNQNSYSINGNFYMIPLDEDGNEIMELLYPLS